jgi:hypothetical protein
LFAVRQFLDSNTGTFGNAGRAERSGDARRFDGICIGPAEQRKFSRRQSPQGQHHVVLHAQRRKQIGDLEGTGNAELRASMRRQLRDVMTIEPDPAAGRRHHSRDSVEQRSLASAVGADDGAALTARHGQADAVDCSQRVEGNHSICQRKDRLGHEYFPVECCKATWIPARRTTMESVVVETQPLAASRHQ